MIMRRIQVLVSLAIGCAVGWTLCAVTACAGFFNNASASDGAQVQTQKCTDAVYNYGFVAPNNETWNYAPAAIFRFPGRTWQDLFASVVVVPPADTMVQQNVPGYEITGGTPSNVKQFYAQDGAVAVFCASAQASATIVVH